MSKYLLESIAEFYNGEWGFTGTRKGLTPTQEQRLRIVLEKGTPMKLHHGGAYGADRTAHAFWRENQIDVTTECIVWPANDATRILFERQQRVVVMAVMDPLDRNRKIVMQSMFIIACPHTEQEEQRSGTWMTIRTALAVQKPVLILWPSGRCTLCRDEKFQRLEV